MFVSLKEFRYKFTRLLASAVLFCGLLGLVVSIESAWADPPPWAPAHGYHAKHKHKDKHKQKHKHKHDHEYEYEYEHDDDYDDDDEHGHRHQHRVYREAPYGIPGGICNREAIGSVVGGVVGGVLGSRVGDGSGRTAATIGGALIGIIVGGAIGKNMDDTDRRCTASVLEYGEDRRPVRWVNPNNGTAYQVTPTTTYQDEDQRYCREYTTEATVAGRRQQIYGTACRQPDGSWQALG